jgi:hypothetical protein
VSRLRPGPGTCYIHPKAISSLDQEGDHDADLDVSGEDAPNYLPWVAHKCRPYLGDRVLEVDAGLGAITARYESRHDVVANDLSPSCVQALREQFVNYPDVGVEDRDLRVLKPGAWPVGEELRVAAEQAQADQLRRARDSLHSATSSASWRLTQPPRTVKRAVNRQRFGR